MMTIQNIHQVSDAHPTVELAMEQLSHMLDEILAGLNTLFEVNGGNLWGVEAISHHVLTVPGENKSIGTGLLSRTEAGPALYVASAMMSVSHNNPTFK
uniref:hypothetical protein n=1 Tax=Arthrobacter sp. TaxID=1667 RepID=UPI000EB7621B|nr:hypothetical protein [Arthrobacter sp.]AXV46259.1 hypothetical protein pA2H2_p28 [Arthrobacter sp.]